MGVLGLGAGVLAAFGQPGQRIDFFEIDPRGESLARDWFSYLASSPAEVRIFCGDGRLTLRTATDTTYDLLIMDAFNSDSIPTHLLTLEATREYLGRLATDGIVLFHLSNRHINLVPVLQATAHSLGLPSRAVTHCPTSAADALPTRWFALGPQAGLDRHLGSAPFWAEPNANVTLPLPWTDAFSSLLPLLWRGPETPSEPEKR